ncbi:MAG: pantoate--beta-alanine ligase [Kiritimatiellae bacterium]|nr:pantoate--beta-alanine ligase [Kiritimatiellia bacterium]
MVVVKTPREMQGIARGIHGGGKTIAVVPTMGFLHEGHLSLVDVAKRSADVVVLTLFVNPIQFGPSEDYAVYPRDQRRDEALCEARGVDYLFAPDVGGMYAPDASVRIDENALSRHLCGAVRPGHFSGVCTVVAKLFNITMADVAVFGQKDAQQVAVVRRMVRDLDIPVRIEMAPIVREADGLAMSSRNTRLTPEGRRSALGLSRALAKARDAYAAGARDAAEIRGLMSREMEAHGLKVDYASAVDYATLEDAAAIGPGTLLAVAAYSGPVRLIDNCLL